VPETSGAEAQDMERESRAYNDSIYLMVSMPYLLVGGVGLLIYRVYRRHAREQARRFADAVAATGGLGHVLAALPADPSEALSPGRGDR
jgi:hypothetical protein